MLVYTCHIDADCMRVSSVHSVCPGWHPLVAAVVDSFHPNDVAMSQASNRILIVTGANGSGKSIFLQQVGIIVYLAHIGCFVPAESAEIGLVDSIFARTCQDGERMETFAHDLTHMGNIMRYASDRSLVLMDELGKVWQSYSQTMSKSGNRHQV